MHSLPRRPAKAREDGRTVNVNINIATWLRDEINLMLVNPRTGRIPHGAWSSFITQALAAHLNNMKATPTNAADDAA